ncbi:DegT/DnrJ/EryC1/StrS family aminotransferase [Candidatus Pelagibacter sp.]|jgi:dTDP-4-amino-4,6-dideoxygalactose transaminase|nr:DegT/DnrJ/EryC1/StrS family aminotransferase [Candidatus Pelagibacter sp.]|tara:strand:- start:1154 stop:2425 length:1272 start_codon:yes stop_codon:yes gene_type:complete
MSKAKQKILSNINKNLKEYYKIIKNTVTSNRITLSEPSFSDKEAKVLIGNFLIGNISQGKNVEEFENAFSKKIGCKYGITTNSGSSANLLALSALKNIYKLKNNDEVIIPASTFATVAMPIIQIGLKPVYVDIDIDTLNININQIKKAITKRTKIIMPVHTLGMPCHMKDILKIAKKNDILVFEDCCEAHGASIKNKKVGSLGLVSAFSFFVAHNITTGEGGMILTNDKNIYNECLSLREFGRIKQSTISSSRYYTDKNLTEYDKRYVFTKMGYNMRMTDLQASVGVIQTKKMDALNKVRASNSEYLDKLINKFLSKDFITTKKVKNYFNSRYTFPIIIKNTSNYSRKTICDYLEKNNIQTRPMMGGCLPDQPGLNLEKGRSVGSLKISRYIKDNCFFVGIHPMIKKTQLKKMVELLRVFLNE